MSNSWRFARLLCATSWPRGDRVRPDHRQDDRDHRRDDHRSRRHRRDHGSPGRHRDDHLAHHRDGCRSRRHHHRDHLDDHRAHRRDGRRSRRHHHGTTWTTTGRTTGRPRPPGALGRPPWPTGRPGPPGTRRHHAGGWDGAPGTPPRAAGAEVPNGLLPDAVPENQRVVARTRCRGTERVVARTRTRLPGRAWEQVQVPGGGRLGSRSRAQVGAGAAGCAAGAGAGAGAGVGASAASGGCGLRSLLRRRLWLLLRRGGLHRSRSRRTTGASIVDDADLTNSPMSPSWAMRALFLHPQLAREFIDPDLGHFLSCLARGTPDLVLCRRFHRRLLIGLSSRRSQRSVRSVAQRARSRSVDPARPDPQGPAERLARAMAAVTHSRVRCT